MKNLMTFQEFTTHSAAQVQKTNNTAASVPAVRKTPAPAIKEGKVSKPAKSPPKLVVLKHHSSTATGEHLYEIKSPWKRRKRPDQIVINPVVRNI